MAKQDIALTNIIVKKSNKIVRARLVGMQNKTASRIAACMIAQITKDETEFKQSYTVRLSDYLDNKDSKSNNLELAKEACRNLAKTFAEIPIDNKGNFSEVPFFAKITYINGTVEAVFNKYASPYLIQLKGLFTEYNLLEYLKLPSLYSQRIFEILKSYEKGLDKGYIDISLNDLRRLLDCIDTYNDWRDFKKYVLDKAFYDINKHTTLKYTWEHLKTGRKITSVRFKFIKEKAVEVKKPHKLKALPDKTEVLPDNAVTAKAFACARKHGNQTCPHNQGETCKKCDELGFRKGLGGGTAGGSSGGLQPAGAILAGLAGMIGKEGKA